MSLAEPIELLGVQNSVLTIYQMSALYPFSSLAASILSSFLLPDSGVSMLIHNFHGFKLPEADLRFLVVDNLHSLRFHADFFTVSNFAIISDPHPPDVISFGRLYFHVLSLAMITFSLLLIWPCLQLFSSHPLIQRIRLHLIIRQPGPSRDPLLVAF